MKNFINKMATSFSHADKVIHFVAGALIAILILWITNEPWFGFAGAFLAGLYKEFTDHMKAKTVGEVQTWLDWFSTMAGGVFIELLWFHI